MQPLHARCKVEQDRILPVEPFIYRWKFLRRVKGEPAHFLELLAALVYPPLRRWP